MHRTALSLSRMVAAVLAAGAMHAAGAATSLLDAWQAARQHDPAFQAARAQWEAGLTKERQGRALLRPEIAATGSAGYLTSNRDTTGAQFSAPDFGASNNATFRTRIDGGATTGWALTAKQPLYDAARWASSRQLDKQAQLADVEFRSAQQQLILRTAQAYFAVVLAEDTLATLRAQKAAAHRALDEAKEKFEAGATPVTDRDEAQARYDEITTQEILAQNNLEMKRVAFTDLTGKPATGLDPVAPDAALDRGDAGTLAAWKERAEQANPLVVMQKLGRDIALDEVAKFRALTSPSVDLVARIADERMQGDSGYGTTHITSNTRLLGVQVTIPLFTGGMRSAKRDEAAALAQKAQADIRALRQEVLRQTQAAWLAVSTGPTRVRAQEQALKSAQSRLGATETGKEVGARTMLDLMNAQTDYYQAQRDLLRAKYDLLFNRLQLPAAAGSLSESDVRAVNSALAAK